MSLCFSLFLPPLSPSLSTPPVSPFLSLSSHLPSISLSPLCNPSTPYLLHAPTSPIPHPCTPTSFRIFRALGITTLDQRQGPCKPSRGEIQPPAGGLPFIKRGVRVTVSHSSVQGTQSTCLPDCRLLSIPCSVAFFPLCLLLFLSHREML